MDYSRLMPSRRDSCTHAMASSSSTQTRSAILPSAGVGAAACGATIVNVKFCVAFGLTPLDAVIVNTYTPTGVALPVKVPVPLPLSVNVTPEGKVPETDNAGCGAPVAETVKATVAPAT